MYSQNCETVALEVLETNFFFAARPSCADLYKTFSKFFPWILQFESGISVIFLKIKRVIFKSLEAATGGVLVIAQVSPNPKTKPNLKPNPNLVSGYEVFYKKRCS